MLECWHFMATQICGRNAKLLSEFVAQLLDMLQLKWHTDSSVQWQQ